MKRIFIPVLLLFLFAHVHCTPVYATSAHAVQHVYSCNTTAQGIGYMPSHGMRSVNSMPAAVRYSATVFEPFNGACPSEYVDGKAPTGPNGRRNGFGPRPDDKPADTSPIGEPWILGIFALLFGGVIAWKNRTFHETITGPCSEKDPK